MTAGDATPAGDGGHDHAAQDHAAHDQVHAAHEHAAHDHAGQDHAGHHPVPDHPLHQHDHDHLDHAAASTGHAHRGGIRGFLESISSAHSHDTADSIDTALTTSTEGLRALKVSLAVLTVTAVLQVVVVVLSGSVALLADTVHNFADALTAVPLGIAFVLSRRPASKRYTYGYGRAEDLAGIFIVAIIAFSAVVAAWEAVDRLLHPTDVRNLGWVAVAGAIGFVGNELVASYRIRVGRRIGSEALVVDGMHARTDGMTSLAVVVGAAGMALGWRLADPIVGLVISAAILAVLKDAARAIYRRLMDSVDPSLVDEVEAVLAAVPGVEAVESVRIRWVGHELHAEAEIVSNGDLSVADAHDIAEQAHHHLLHDIRRLARATIHTSPCGHDGLDHHATTAHHFRS